MTILSSYGPKDEVTHPGHEPGSRVKQNGSHHLPTKSMNDTHVEILTTLEENNTQGYLNFKNHSSNKIQLTLERSGLIIVSQPPPKSSVSMVPLHLQIQPTPHRVLL